MRDLDSERRPQARGSLARGLEERARRLRGRRAIPIQSTDDESIGERCLGRRGLELDCTQTITCARRVDRCA